MVQKFCKSCGSELIPGKEFCPKCLARISAPIASTIMQYPKDTPENRAKKMKEFKVIVMEQEWNIVTGAKSNKQLIEQSLNSYGLEGWSVKAIAIRQIPGIGTITYENLMILERDMPLES